MLSNKEKCSSVCEEKCLPSHKTLQALYSINQEIRKMCMIDNFVQYMLSSFKKFCNCNKMTKSTQTTDVEQNGVLQTYAIRQHLSIEFADEMVTFIYTG